MKHLHHLFKRKLQAVPAKVAVVFLAIALLGFADASYLTIEHYRNSIPPCTTAGCETVLTSDFAVVSGLPVALLGAIYYLVIAVGAFAFLESKNHEILRVTLLLTVLGLLASLWFVMLQAFVIHAWCQYCLLSAATSTALCIFAVGIFNRYKVSVSMPEHTSL